MDSLHVQKVHHVSQSHPSLHRLHLHEVDCAEEEEKPKPVNGRPLVEFPEIDELLGAVNSLWGDASRMIQEAVDGMADQAAAGNQAMESFEEDDLDADDYIRQPWESAGPQISRPAGGGFVLRRPVSHAEALFRPPRGRLPPSPSLSCAFTLL